MVEIISLIFLLINFAMTVVKPRFGFEELFEEIPKSSHSQDELLILLGFLSFEGFPIEKSCVHCANVMNIILLHLLFV